MSLPFSASAQVNVPALRMVEMFFDRCLEPLIQERPIITEGLNELDNEAVLKAEDPYLTGSLWFARDAHVSLHAMKGKTGTFDGCMVQQHSGLGQRRIIHASFVIEQFDQWAEAQIANGRFVEVRRCGTPEGEYFLTLESRMTRRLPIRVLINSLPEINYVFLIAAETPIEPEAAKPCDPG